MQSSSTIPPLRDVVLIGGGHSHVQVLKSFGMRPEPGVRLTLITPTLQTPYSGMLPGALAGIYQPDQIHIQLQPLCRFAGARMILAPAAGIDAIARQVLFDSRPPLRYDWLSINCGAVPQAPVAAAVTAKPISELLPKWRDMCATMLPGDTLVVVGAGAAGVELAMAARAVLSSDCAVALIGSTLLAGHSEAARQHVRGHLDRLNIQWREGYVVAQDTSGVTLRDGMQVDARHVLWVTQVEAPQWLRESGLTLDESGFVVVDESLRSVSHPQVFAAGDVAELRGQSRPKSGVYAVRAGPILAQNLRQAARGQQLAQFTAQPRHLALISTSDGQAVASWGKWALSGSLLWRLKHWIDRRFVNNFNILPDVSVAHPKLPAGLAEVLPDQPERCGGCGAKIAADPLHRVLQRLPAQPSARVQLGIGDDAAQLRNISGSTLLSVDGFRAMLDDPYLFGRISAHHSLNDIFAMAARPTAGLVFATIPLMADALVEEELFQLLRGVVDVLNGHDVPLVGGHSAEGAELSIAVTVVGEPGDRVLHKRGARPGDSLLLTKPIGTGVILAGAMRGRCPRSGYEHALRMMDMSNATALRVLLDNQASAMTDITGFGLSGHLGELLSASGVGVCVNLDAVPVIDGAVELIAQLQSALQYGNEQALQQFDVSRAGDPARLRLLADPQTSGGLLASVPQSHAMSCLGQLRQSGYEAALIGNVTGDAQWIIE